MYSFIVIKTTLLKCSLFFSCFHPSFRFLHLFLPWVQYKLEVKVHYYSFSLRCGEKSLLLFILSQKREPGFFFFFFFKFQHRQATAPCYDYTRLLFHFISLHSTPTLRPTPLCYAWPTLHPIQPIFPPVIRFNLLSMLLSTSLHLTPVPSFSTSPRSAQLHSRPPCYSVSSSHLVTPGPPSASFH